MAIISRKHQYPMQYGIYVTFVVLWVSCIHSVSARCSCYSYHGEKVLHSWSGSRGLCEKGNGDLVSMETLDEWEFIKKQIQSRSTKQYDSDEWWIGLRYIGRNWKWLSNNSTLDYNKWQPSKPSNMNNQQKHYTMIAKQWPNENHQGSFNNEKDSLQRGYICEYQATVGLPACKNNIQWCSRSPTVPTTSQTRTRTTIAATSLTRSPRTTAPPSLATDPSSQPRKSKSFPFYIIIIVLVILLVSIVILVVFIIRLKKKRESKPRNSHLSRDSRVPVKLEHNSSDNNLNDKIIYADVLNMDGDKIQINCGTQNAQNANTTDGNPCHKNAVYATIPEKKNNNRGMKDYANTTRNEDANSYNIKKKKKRTDYDEEMVEYSPNRRASNASSDRVFLVNDMDCTPVEQNDKCLYATVGDRSTDLCNDNDNKDSHLLYAQLADFEELDPKSPPKIPSPYAETDYATIVKSSN